MCTFLAQIHNEVPAAAAAAAAAAAKCRCPRSPQLPRGQGPDPGLS